MSDTLTKDSKQMTIDEIPAFVFEADHPRNSNLLIQSIPGCILRSAISGTRTVKDSKSGEELVPIDQVRTLGQFPKTPGMQLWIHPETLKYRIQDPLEGDEDMLERIQKYLNRYSPFRTGERIKGVETIKGELDKHRMKTLCREIHGIVHSGEGKIVNGILPEIELIKQLPGDFMLNPGSRIQNTQPRYEKDWESWVDSLSTGGG